MRWDRKVPNRKATIVIFCSALIVFVSMGIRQSFGLFLAPISQDLGIGREVFSLAIAWQNLIFGLPIVGILSDYFGPRWVVAGGALLYAVCFFLLSSISTSLGLYTVLGVLMGIALSSISYVVVLGAVAQVVAPEKRASFFGLITAAGSFGTFALVPGVQWLLSGVGWQSSFAFIALVAGASAFLAIGIPQRGRDVSPNTIESHDGSLLQVLLQARGHSGYWLLNAGFFVCGFHVAFIATHLPAFLTDHGLSKMVGATALSLIGLFNIFGSYLSGQLGDRYRKKYLLSLLYLGRAIVISGFLFISVTNTSALVFGSLIGFLWLATVPLTSGTVAQIFGSRYLSTLYGIVFFSHQIGSFSGVWLAGRVYDATGSYDMIWIAAILLAVTSSLVHLPIADKPVQRLETVRP